MKIQKNWFYLIDDSFSENIEIWEWVYAFVFLNETEKSFNFNLRQNSRLDYFWFFSKKSSSKIEFNQSEDNSLLNVKQMFFNHKIDLTSNIKSIIASNNSNSFINIISIIKDNKLSIDSSIEIEQWLIWVEADLKQKNIFIWDSWSVRWLPKLNVKSFNVKASHSCKVERINDEILFYLKSRWISENEAIIMLIESFFIKNFGCLKMMDNTIYDKVYNDFLILNR